MIFIVLDLEATCWKNDREKQNEIIEIGAVSISENGQKTDEFVQFIRPNLHPQLSQFCTELTSITQKDVDSAPYFPEAQKKFLKWIQSFEEDWFLCSWGFYDLKQLKKDCKLHGIPPNWLKNHISVKHQYGKLKGMKRPPGMATALEMENIPLEGTHHRGIDDARNIAKIFVKYLDWWKFK